MAASVSAPAIDLNASLLACFLGTQLLGRGCCAGKRTDVAVFSCLGVVDAVVTDAVPFALAPDETFAIGSNAEKRLDTRLVSPVLLAVVGVDGEAAAALNEDPAVSAKKDARLAAIELVTVPALETPGDDGAGAFADSAMLRSCAALQLAIRPSSAGDRPIAVES